MGLLTKFVSNLIFVRSSTLKSYLRHLYLWIISPLLYGIAIVISLVNLAFESEAGDNKILWSDLLKELFCIK